MRILLAVLTAALTACNTTMPRQSTGPDPTEECIRTVFNNPELSILAPKVGSLLDINNVRLEMLSDTSIPTEAEKAALKIWAEGRPYCTALGRDFRARYVPPQITAAFEGAQADLFLLTSRLYSGELNYGQFNTQRQQLAARTNASIQAARQQLQQQVSAEEASRRAMALQIFQQQQTLQQMNRPTTTNCTRFFDQVNCTTR